VVWLVFEGMNRHSCTVHYDLSVGLYVNMLLPLGLDRGGHDKAFYRGLSGDFRKHRLRDTLMSGSIQSENIA
jgi:hypothetical protein